MADVVFHLVFALMATVLCVYLVGTGQWCFALFFAFWTIVLAGKAITLARLNLLISSLRYQVEQEIRRIEEEQRDD